MLLLRRLLLAVSNRCCNCGHSLCDIFSFSLCSIVHFLRIPHSWVFVALVTVNSSTKLFHTVNRLCTYFYCFIFESETDWISGSRYSLLRCPELNVIIALGSVHTANCLFCLHVPWTAIGYWLWFYPASPVSVWNTIRALCSNLVRYTPILFDCLFWNSNPPFASFLRACCTCGLSFEDYKVSVVIIYLFIYCHFYDF